MLRFYRDLAAHVSDELTVFAALAHAPDGSGMKLAAFIVCHTGGPEQAERDLAPFKGFGSPHHGRGGADALPGDQHDPRRQLPHRR